jgi:site-specific recombinase XerD
MTGTAAFTASEWAGITRCPTKNQTYQHVTALGPEIRSYLDWKELSGAAFRTRDDYERTLARLALAYPDMAVGGWTDAMMLEVIMSWPEKSRRRAAAAVRDFFKWALLTDRVDRNETQKLPRIKPPAQKTIVVFTELEEAQLCDLPLRDGALMRLLFGAGLRRAEAGSLRLRDCSLDERRLKVLGKGRKGRVIPVGASVVNAIAELSLLEGISPDEYLWYTTRRNIHSERILRDEPVAASGMHRWWVRCLREAEVDDYKNLHVTRHTYATRFLQAGGSLQMLSRMMGHSSVAVTDAAYSHLETGDMAAELDRVLAVRERAL